MHLSHPSAHVLLCTSIYDVLRPPVADQNGDTDGATASQVFYPTIVTSVVLWVRIQNKLSYITLCRIKE